MFWNTIKVGLKNLMLHKLRSLLTALGVILGVGSVIAMLAVGEGSKKEALERIRNLGSTNIIIRSVKPAENKESPVANVGQNGSSDTQIAVLEYGLRHQDLTRLTSTLPTVKSAVPISLVVGEASFRHRRSSPRG